jgi:hypothetical protein
VERSRPAGRAASTALSLTKIFPGIREIPEIRGQILKTPVVIKPSNQSKPALSLT